MTTLLKILLYILVSANLANEVLSDKIPARSQESYIRIQNFAGLDVITTIVSGIDPFDWEDSRGPEGNFQDVQIPFQKSESRREEVNYYASNCPFTMTLIFSDGSRDTFSINQKFAIGEASADFQHSEATHNLIYERIGSNTLQITLTS